MNKTELVIEILEDISQFDESEIMPETLLVEEMGMDSMDFVEIAATIEELTDEAPLHMNWKTVQDIVDTVTWTPGHDENS
jgi:acyl carrier protein